MKKLLLIFILSSFAFNQAQSEQIQCSNYTGLNAFNINVNQALGRPLKLHTKSTSMCLEYDSGRLQCWDYLGLPLFVPEDFRISKDTMFELYQESVSKSNDDNSRNYTTFSGLEYWNIYDAASQINLFCHAKVGGSLQCSGIKQRYRYDHHQKKLIKTRFNKIKKIKVDVQGVIDLKTKGSAFSEIRWITTEGRDYVIDTNFFETFSERLKFRHFKVEVSHFYDSKYDLQLAWLNDQKNNYLESTSNFLLSEIMTLNESAQVSLFYQHYNLPDLYRSLGDGWGAAAKCALSLSGDFMDCADVDRLNNHESDAVHRHAFPVKIKKVSSASNNLDYSALLGFDGTVRFNEISKRILFQNATDIATHALFTVCALTGDSASH